jgi:hypothetical protein
VLEMQGKITNPLVQVSLLNDDSIITFELSMFATNIKKEICDVLESFLSLKEDMKKKVS